MSDFDTRLLMVRDIERYIQNHPGCTMTDICEMLYPRYSSAFPRCSCPIQNIRHIVTSHIRKLIKYRYITVGEHPSEMVKGKPLRLFTWSDDDGSD